jgi:ABC-type transporter Mla subunit MlaD
MRPWQRQTRRRLVVGGVLASAVVLLLLATIFARQFLTRQAPTRPLVVLFPQGADFRAGSPVLLAGHPVGVVHAIDFVAPTDEADAHLALRVAIDTTYWDFLRADSEASAETPRLLQRIVVLQILPGSAASRQLQPGDTLRARPPVTLDDLADRAREIGPGLGSLLADGRTLERTVTGRRTDLRWLENELERAKAELDLLSTNVRGGPLYRLMNDPATRDRLDRIRASAEEIASAVADRRMSFQPAAKRLARQVELVIAGISEIEALIDKPRGFATRAKDDVAIQRAIERLRAQIDSLVNQLRRQPFRSMF